MKVKVVRVPFLLPTWAQAQVLLPRTIYVKRGIRMSTALLAHELRHVAQIEEMGLPRYWGSYIAGLMKGGYDYHPMEEEARRAENSAAHRAAASAILNAIGAHGAGTVAVPPF